MNPMEYYLKRARKVKYSKEDYKSSYPVGGSDYYHDFDPTVHPKKLFEESSIKHGHESFSNGLFDSSKNQLASITHEPSYYAEPADGDIMPSNHNVNSNGVINSKIKLTDSFYDLSESERKKAFTHILDNISHVNSQFNNGPHEHALFNFDESNEPFDLSDFEKDEQGSYKFNGKPSLWNVPDEKLSEYGHPNDYKNGGWDEYMNRWKGQDFTKIDPSKFHGDYWLNSRRPLLDDLHNHLKDHLRNSLDYKRLKELILNHAVNGGVPTKDDLVFIADNDQGHGGHLEALRRALHNLDHDWMHDNRDTFTKMGYPHLDWILNAGAISGPQIPKDFTVNELRDILRKHGHKNTRDIESWLFPKTAEVVDDDE